MPIVHNPVAKRLMRWMLPHTQPEYLALEHAAQQDIAEAADEIERLYDFALNVAALDDRQMQNTAILKQWREDARTIIAAAG